MVSVKLAVNFLKDCILLKNRWRRLRGLRKVLLCPKISKITSPQASRTETMYVVDNLQYANWSEKIFKQMREGGVDAVHVTIAYHEIFREMVANIEQWNRWFEAFPS